ncbi:MAG: hypothetical protein KA020_02140 [Planctomycetes bacterium]|nr:hypothetical protein [Planctomycetota bacterium]MCC7061716.1 hypothetical protein [Planctomycetota bacterium]
MPTTTPDLWLLLCTGLGLVAIASLVRFRGSKWRLRPRPLAKATASQQ